MIIIFASLAALCLSLIIGLSRRSNPTGSRDPVQPPSSTGSKGTDTNAPNAPATVDDTAQAPDASGMENCLTNQTKEGGSVQCKER